MFILHPQLEQDGLSVSKLHLCEVRLINNAYFPWLILVPMQDNIKEITDLTAEDQHLLIKEISQCSQVLQAVTQADKMNIAALGNQVPQLHVHIIARFSSDKAWPNPVWGSVQESYNEDSAQAFIERLQTALFPAKCVKNK